MDIVIVAAFGFRIATGIITIGAITAGIIIVAGIATTIIAVGSRGPSSLAVNGPGFTRKQHAQRSRMLSGIKSHASLMRE